MNSLIHLAKQMGLINQRFYNYLPNATVCKGNEPQIDNDHVVIVKLRNIYGMLVLLALGISVALTSFIAENWKLLCRGPREPGHFHFLLKIFPRCQRVTEHSQGQEASNGSNGGTEKNEL